MANSGSFSTSAYNNRCVDFNWSIAAQSIEGNYTVINWNIVGGGSQTQYYKAGGFTVVIDGETVYSTSTDTRIQLYNGTVVASGQKTIYHNADGSRNFGASVSAGIYTYAVNVSGSGSWWIDAIPRAASITSAIDITDEDNPYFTFSNPAGFDLTAELEINPTNTHLFSRTISNTGSYTFELTDEERETLRGNLVNAKTATLRYLLYSNGGAFVSYVDRTLSITNAEPTIEASAFDIGETSTLLTGDDTRIIKSFNCVEVSMAATAYKGASISSYKITNAGNVIDSNSGAFNNAESGVFTFSATDSRGVTVSKDIELTVVDYIKPTCNLTISAPNAEGEISFSIGGNYFNNTFGAEHNTIAIEYRYQADNEGYTDWISVDYADYTFSETTYKVEVYADGLDYTKAYTFQARAIDSINIVESAFKTVKTQTIFDWGENDFNFNVSVNAPSLTIGGNAVDYIVEEGDSGIWHYRKWDSGFVELYGYTVQDVSITTPFSNIYRVGDIPFALPFPLTSSYNMQSSVTGFITVAWTGQTYIDGNNAWVDILATTATTTTVRLYLLITGRWK